MDNHNLSKICASLVVSGDEWDDPDILTNIINIRPSKVVIRGEERTGKRPCVSLTEWIFETDWIKSDNVEDVIRLVVEPFLSIHADFTDFVLKNELRVTIVCSVEIYSERPEFDLSNIIIKKIGILNSAIGFDIYDFSAEAI